MITDFFMLEKKSATKPVIILCRGAVWYFFLELPQKNICDIKPERVSSVTDLKKRVALVVLDKTIIYYFIKTIRHQRRPKWHTK